jgi:Ser/Thr protein kinase RdoA (MazF antagonist)
MNTTDHELTLADLNFDPPTLPAERLREIARSCFGVEGKFQPLEGERDQNNRVTTQDGRQYVLKISSAGEDPQVVDFQVQALLHIASRDAAIPVPRQQQGLDGKVVYYISSEKGEHAVRLLSWLPGIRYQDGPPPSLTGLEGVGEFLARLSLALAGFSHPAAGHFMPWDSTNGLIFKPQMVGLLPPEVEDLAGPVLERLETRTFPALKLLPRQIIHHDAHGGNLLRDSIGSEHVAGVIDFGDMVQGPLIADLAVSAAYFAKDAGAPAEAAAALCRGFHRMTELSASETDLLLDLMIARQVLNLQLDEFRQRNMEHPPEFISEDMPGVVASFKALAALDGIEFGRILREACA